MATNIMVSDKTHQRLTDLKPYESLSYGEFVDELLDQYESNVATEEGSP